MKVRVSFTVDIDPEAWTENYGVAGRQAIIEDVKTYVENGVKQELDGLGLLARTEEPS